MKKGKNKKNENKVTVIRTMGIPFMPEDLKELLNDRKDKTFSERLEEGSAEEMEDRPIQQKRRSLREKISGKLTGKK